MMIHESQTKYEAIEKVKEGASLRAVASEVGASYESVRRWCRKAGIAFATGSMGGAILTTTKKTRSSNGQRLRIEHRLTIAAGICANMTYAQIAHGIGFSRTTVGREIARHGGRSDYDPYLAQMRADRDARRPKARKIDESARVREYVLEKLCQRWSPVQISTAMRKDFPDDEEMRVSHEAIYQALYVQGKGALRQELKLEKALRSGRKNRLPQSRLAAKRGKDKSWVEGCEISLRPAEAADRAVPGHWEGDLMIGGDMRSCLITLVERQTRFVLVSRLELHPTELVTSRLATMVEEIPKALMRTITWDQGVEMASHVSFTKETGVKVYFCDPHSPWQRGTNENTNGLIRDYFPKGTDFTKVTDEEVQEMQDQLNTRPRQTLGWRNPAEAFSELLAKAA